MTVSGRASPVSDLQVLEWGAWDRFLITHIVPAAKRVRAVPGATVEGLTAVTAPVLLHVNLSRPAAAFPDYHAWLANQEAAGSPVLNGYCRSIDKWAVQEGCAAAGLPVVRAVRDGDPDDMLVLKARANYCGMYEQLLPAGLVGDMAPPPWPYPERVHRLARREVPEDAWTDRRITIERYVGNTAGRFARAYVAGDFVAVAIAHSPLLVKEMDQREEVALVSTSAASLLPVDNNDMSSVASRLASAMRVDYGAIDLAIDEHGTPHPIDVNTTPSWGIETDLNPRLVAELREAFASLTLTGSRYAPPAAPTQSADPRSQS